MPTPTPPRALHDLFRRLSAGADEARDAARQVGAAARAAGRSVIVISACLCGEPVRWDGADRLDEAALARVQDAAREGRLLPLCPELLAGLGCPRPPVSFANGHGATSTATIRDDAGRDVTVALQAGADRALALALEAADASGLPREQALARAVLKERSPSCGAREVHGPAGVQPGLGLFAAALVRRGVAVEDEHGDSALRLPVLQD